MKPLVVQSKAQEDYQPNLQLLVDQGADLMVGVGFMLENAVEAMAKDNPKSSFLLIDSPILDAKGTPYRAAQRAHRRLPRGGRQLPGGRAGRAGVEGARWASSAAWRFR